MRRIARAGAFMTPQTAIDTLTDLIETRENLGDEENCEAWHGAAGGVLTTYFGESSVHVRNFAEAASWRGQELSTGHRHRRDLARMRAEAADRAKRVLREALYAIAFSMESCGPLDDVSMDLYAWENIRAFVRVRDWVKVPAKWRRRGSVPCLHGGSSGELCGGACRCDVRAFCPVGGRTASPQAHK